MKKLTKLLVCLLVMLAVLASTSAVFADSKGEVYIRLEEDVRKEDVPFFLWRIAAIPEDGTVRLSGAFEQIPVVPELDEAGSANALASFAQDRGITPDFVAVTDLNGIATFPLNRDGIYLVIGAGYACEDVYCEVQPALFVFPANEEGEVLTHFSVSPKMDRTPIGDEDPKEISRHVLKVWKNEHEQSVRPETLTVRLLKDGEPCATAILSDKNNWAHTFEGLDPAASYTVAEVAPEGYTVRLTRDGATFVLTNTANDPLPPEDPEDPDRLPQTGVIWWPIAAASFMGLVFVLIGVLRRRTGDA